MRVYLSYVLVAILRVGVAQASKFESALDLIMRYHGKDSQALANTLDSLTQIATKLRDEPEDPRYRSIRILNKTFWERVGSVNGGISFMSALGFDLVEQGACRYGISYVHACMHDLSKVKLASDREANWVNV